MSEYAKLMGYAPAPPCPFCEIVHEQHQCPGCDLWVIWTPLAPGSLVTCWHRQERNVDPATLGEDDGIPDEPLCAGCRAAETAQLEADRIAWAADAVQRRWREAT
jgi:hypothetical protein